MRVNAETCGSCPYYRRKRWWRREGCDYPVMADRCPMEPAGPRLLSWDEAMQEEVVWMERRGVADIEMMAVVDYRGGNLSAGDPRDRDGAGRRAPKAVGRRVRVLGREAERGAAGCGDLGG